MNLNFKITASYFGSQEILTAAHMPLGTPFFRSQSHYQRLSVKTPEKFCACNSCSFIPFKNFAVAFCFFPLATVARTGSLLSLSRKTEAGSQFRAVYKVFSH